MVNFSGMSRERTFPDDISFKLAGFPVQKTLDPKGLMCQNSCRK